MGPETPPPSPSSPPFLSPGAPGPSAPLPEPIERIRRRRRSLAESGPTRQRADGDFELVGLPAADCDVLRDLTMRERARSVIEIGLAYGASALALAEALARTEHEVGVGHRYPDQVVIDAHQASEYGDLGRTVLAAAGVTDRCRFEIGLSQLVLPRLVEQGLVVDLAFVDGSHIFHNVFVDLHFLRSLVRPGGLIVLDDCDWPSVAAAVDYFERNTGWVSEPIGVPTRLRAYRLPDPPIEPHFADFVPFGPADRGGGTPVGDPAVNRSVDEEID